MKMLKQWHKNYLINASFTISFFNLETGIREPSVINSSKIVSSFTKLLINFLFTRCD